MTVVDLGAGSDPDPRADVTLDAHDEADLQADLRLDWPLASASVDGLVASHVVEHLPDLDHFFREAARVLQPSGWLDVTVPVGADAVGDPDHEHQFEWRTLATFGRDYSDSQGRPWDTQVPLVMTERNPEVWFHPPLHHLTPALQWAAKRWPREAIRRCSSGEVTVRYRRVVQ